MDKYFYPHDLPDGFLGDRREEERDGGRVKRGYESAMSKDKERKL